MKPPRGRSLIHEGGPITIPQLSTEQLELKRELPDRRSITDEQIKAVAGRALLKILHDYGNFNVGTIDSFFQRVLRNLARELGKGSRFNIDLNDIKAVAEAVREVIAQAHNDTVLLDWGRKG